MKGATKWAGAVVLLTAAIVGQACSAGNDTAQSSGSGGSFGSGGSSGSCKSGETRCDGQHYQTCKDGSFQTQKTCSAGEVCMEGVGCAACPLGACGNGGSGGGSVLIPDPTTCEEAATSRTYLGCDFWPTVLDNIVRPTFDFAVVVANAGTEDADVTVTQMGMTMATATVKAGSLAKIYLPWVEALKSTSWMQNSPDNGCPTWAKTATVDAKGGGYHLVATRPVAVYQFNAIEYAAKGGAPGKDWSDCSTKTCFGTLPASKCFSYTNDASLLLPSTALTGNYRVAGPPPWTENQGGDPPSNFTFPAYFGVTGTQDGTMVTVHLSSTGAISGGDGIASVPKGGTTTFMVDAGDVVMVEGTTTSDFSGSLIQATAPVQVISGIACTYMPHNTEACDHLEETVLPVETLGKNYFVTRPTGPTGTPKGHVVRIYGNVDGTQLTYTGGNPGGPSTINAGDVVDLGMVNNDFEVEGDHEFTVSSFMTGAGPVSGNRQGDPSQTFMVTVEQFRLKYIFLAPDDYDVSYTDVVAPVDAHVVIDGVPVMVAPTPIGSGYGVMRIKLGSGTDGAHVLTSDKPVGMQVLGYGAYTSYQYPGGLNLGKIAPVPVK